MYGPQGVVSHWAVEELREPHSAMWRDRRLVVVSTLTNSILWLAHDGSVVRRWRLPGEGDSCHLNSLATRHGHLLVSAFGRFREHREWADPERWAGRGIVIDVASGREVLSGFSAPHNPVWLGDGWLICNSAEGTLLRLDRRGAAQAEVHLSGWTRGLVVSPDRVHVGVSAHRVRGAERGHAFVAELTRDGLEERHRWDLPSREIYDLAYVPAPLVDGIQRGADRLSAAPLAA